MDISLSTEKIILCRKSRVKLMKKSYLRINLKNKFIQISGDGEKLTFKQKQFIRKKVEKKERALVLKLDSNHPENKNCFLEIKVFLENHAELFPKLANGINTFFGFQNEGESDIKKPRLENSARNSVIFNKFPSFPSISTANAIGIDQEFEQKPGNDRILGEVRSMCSEIKENVIPALSSPESINSSNGYFEEYWRNDLDHRRLYHSADISILTSILQSLSSLEPFLVRMRQLYNYLFVMNRNIVHIINGVGQNWKITLLMKLFQFIHKLSQRNRRLSRKVDAHRKLERISETEILEVKNILLPKLGDCSKDPQKFLTKLFEFIEHLCESISQLYWKEIVIPYNITVSKKKIKKHCHFLKLRPKNTFTIYTRNRIFCEKCGNETISNEIPIMELSITAKNGESVQELVDNSLPKCYLGDEKCGICTDVVGIFKMTRIVRFPRILIINRKEVSGGNSSFGTITPFLDGSQLRKFEKSQRENSPCFNISPSPVKNNQSGRRRAEKRQLPDDVELIEERIYSKIPFVPFLERRKTMEILQFCQISVNLASISSHAFQFPKNQRKKIEVNAPPRQTIPIEEDGNCFYRAISWWFTGSQEFYRNFRRVNAKLMKKNQKKLSELTSIPISSLIESVEKDAEWSNEIEIILICTVFNLEIFTFYNEKWIRYQPISSISSSFRKSQGAIYLKNRSNHFEPVLKCSHPEVENEQFNDKKQFHRTCFSYGSGLLEFENNSKLNLEQADDIGPIYKLYSVICSENLEDVEYYAFTKDMFTDEWTCCKNESVEILDEKRVLDICSESGVMFFYVKLLKNQGNDE